jgi:hypothetical protein
MCPKKLQFSKNNFVGFDIIEFKIKKWSEIC